MEIIKVKKNKLPDHIKCGCCMGWINSNLYQINLNPDCNIALCRDCAIELKIKLSLCK